jgi:hypothetical protein
MSDQPASSTARFVILVAMFFGLLAFLVAIMVGVAMEVIASVAVGLIALSSSIWLVTRKRR